LTPADLNRDHPHQISASSTLRWITIVKVFCLWRSQYKCQSRHKQHTKSHHYNCDGVVSGNLEHRETPKIADRPVWSRNGRRWIFASSRKRKTTFFASKAHCQDQDCSKLLSSNFLGEMGQRDGTDWGLQASHETGHDDDGQDLHRPLHANYKKEITQLILAMSGSGRRNWMQTHKLVGSR
jgi:hypothetical protein